MDAAWNGVFSKQSAVSTIMWWKTLEELGYPKNKVNGVNVKLLREIKEKARLNAESARSFQNNPCLSKLTDKSLVTGNHSFNHSDL